MPSIRITVSPETYLINIIGIRHSVYLKKIAVSHSEIVFNIGVQIKLMKNTGLSLSG